MVWFGRGTLNDVGIRDLVFCALDPRWLEFGFCELWM